MQVLKRLVLPVTETAVLVVGDDVSVGRKRSGSVGRRGLAGTILMQKIIRAMAQKKEGAMLNELHHVGHVVIDSLATVGVALDHVHIVGRPKEGFQSTTDRAELGVGIHNETGCRIIHPQPHITDLVDQILNQLLDTTDEDHAHVDSRTENWFYSSTISVGYRTGVLGHHQDRHRPTQ
ncbi:Dak1 domain-containing protein [Aspergillus granulosus]|uniref:Dak1 domain-containing protein n=1 Tax=Aspergillus granulosus TaxID=176169 RepID=A0ABR4H0D8_9EURO